jgi:putative FmdB family regulatory protein
MPIYEYRCTQCEHKLETLQRLSEAPLVTCPECGKDALQKLVSAAGFQLKGSGWYVTDFRGGSSKAADKPSTDKPAESKPETTKSDATASKSDSTTTTSTPAASDSTTKAA